MVQPYKGAQCNWKEWEISLYYSLAQMPQVKWGKKPDGTVIACSHRGHPNGYEDHCGYYQKEKKKRKQMFPRMWKNWSPFVLLVGIYQENGTATVKNGTMVTQNFLNRIIIWSSNSTPEYITQRTESRVSRYLYIHVHSSSIHNCWNVEANQIFAEGWMNKQSVVFTYNGMLFSLKKKILILSIIYINLRIL